MSLRSYYQDISYLIAYHIQAGMVEKINQVTLEETINKLQTENELQTQKQVSEVELTVLTNVRVALMSYLKCYMF